MKKGMLLVVALLLVGSSAFATQSRDAALQSQGWMVMDDANIANLPTNVLGYKGTLIGELGTNPGTNDYATVIIALGPGVLGLSGGNIPLLGSASDLLGDVGNAAPLPIGAGSVAAAGPGANTGMLSTAVPHGRLAAVYGLSLSGGMNVAGGVEYYATNSGGMSGDDAAGDPWGSVSDGASAINVVGGVSLAVAMLDPLEIGVRLGLPTAMGKQYNDPADVTQTFESSGLGIDVAARGAMKDLMGENTTSYALLALGMGNVTAKSTNDALDPSTLDTQKLSEMMIMAGLATNVRVGEATTIIWGVSVMSLSNGNNFTDEVADQTTNYSSSMLVLPLTIAAETKILSWLTGRISSQSGVISGSSEKADSDIDDAVDKTDVDTGYENLSLGLTINVGEKTQIDGVLTQAFMFDGPYLIGGIGNGLMSQVSVVTRF
jgi:hypothetical protein